MKDYPSIAGSVGQKFYEIQRAQVFDKIDGSSMRSEWNPKQGWYKHGKRSGLTDDSNPHLVAAPDVFLNTIGRSHRQDRSGFTMAVRGGLLSFDRPTPPL